MATDSASVLCPLSIAVYCPRNSAYPTIEGLKQTLDVQALTDQRASKAKAEELVELRFVDEMKKSGFVDKLYGRK